MCLVNIESFIMTTVNNFLPYQAFKHAMSFIDWHDTVELDANDNYRPAGLEQSIEEFLDVFLQHPYVRNHSYFVIAKQEGKLTQSFAEYYNRLNLVTKLPKPSFCAMCFFPKENEVQAVLPKDSLHELPQKLWKERVQLPQNRWDRGENKIKDKQPIIYINNSNEVVCKTFEISPTFGQSIRSQVTKFVLTNELNEWLKSKEGKQFQKNALLNVLKEKAPNAYEAQINSMSSKQIIELVSA